MSNKFTKKIYLRMSKEDKRIIKRAAKISSKSMAAFIREAAEEDAKWVVCGDRLLTTPFKLG